MRNFVLLFSLLSILLPQVVAAQNFERLWATGSAVPDGQTIELTKRPDGQYRFAGALVSGELKVMTTETFEKGVTQFLKPQLVDSYLINKGITYQYTKDETQPGWVVSFPEDAYSFLVDPANRKLTGELVFPWNEMLIAGSAFEGGANEVEWSRDAMLSFEQDHDNPYVFSWTGVLGEYDGVIEPGRFKLEGQMTWGPREFHPYQQDEDILRSTQMRKGGADTKWRVTQQGVYRIVVDVFQETFHAELLSGTRSVNDGSTAIESVDALDNMAPSTIYDLNGQIHRSFKKGLNLVRMPDGRVRKVIVR
jgi:hypothetical protein